MSTHARPLATWLAAADDDALTSLFRARHISADPGWDDFFDAAESLTEQGSIHRALDALPRTDADTLLSARDGAAITGATRERLTGMALLDASGSLLTPVREQLMDRTVPESADVVEPLPADDVAAARAAERATRTMTQLAEMLLAARETPLGLLATGAMAAGERKRLAEADVHDAEMLRVLAESAGLLRSASRALHTTAAGEAWLLLPFAERWQHIVDAFRRSLPEGIRDDGEVIPSAAWDDAYPWSPEWPERAATLRSCVRLLGVETSTGAEPEWAAFFRRGERDALAGLAALVPAEVDKVFLQNDLTAISPGTLLPALEIRLRNMAERDVTQSSSYRFTPESLGHALVEGESAEGIVAFLTDISLTGLPQPLMYLIEQTAQRHGLVRVSDGEQGSVVTSRDAQLLDTISVDRRLRPLALHLEDGMLVSRVSPDTAYWALIDARYPATLVDPEGNAVSKRRGSTVPASPDEPVDYAPLIARLRSHQGADADAAWLDRELEAAVRTRTQLRVEIAMPDGSSRELTLEPTGLGGGRLRGRDLSADVERTLPVRSIRSVHVVGD